MNLQNHKFLFSAAMLIAGLSAFYSYNTFQRARTIEQEIDNYSALNRELLAAIEENTQQRLALEKDIDRLNNELLLSAAHVSGLDSTIVDLQARVDPDYESLREQARQEIAAEQEQPNDNPLAGVMKLYSDPDLAYSMATMQVNSLYSGFLNALDSSTLDIDAIRELLIDTTVQQNLLLMEIASGEVDSAEPRESPNPNAIVDALSSVLSSDEIELFGDYQETQTRRIYESAYKTQLSMTAPDLPEDVQELVVATIVAEIGAVTDPTMINFIPNGSNDDILSSIYDRQLEALRIAQNQLASEVAPEYRGQIDRFVEQLVDQQEMVIQMTELMSNPQ
jgi:hypothetical protein